jgi:hypothetical protein
MDPRRSLIDQTCNSRFTKVDGFIQWTELGARDVPRNGSIIISSVPTGSGDQRFYIELNGPAFDLKQDKPVVGASTNFNATQLVSYVDDCRRAWQSVINEARRLPGWRFWRTEQPYMARVRQQENDLVTRKLAVAGTTLFQQIFLQSEGNMPDVAKHLSYALNGKSCFITVYSETFFIPWGMLYVHPTGRPPLGSDGANADPDGFVGYRHVIEQATDAKPLPAAIVPLEQAIAFGFTFDPAIDRSNIRAVQQQRQYFNEIGGLHPRAERSSKDQLRKAFVSEGLPDQVSYFYLHGRTSNPDNLGATPAFFIGAESISANELKAWAEWGGREAALPGSPLMVFNACQSGQLRSLFYESFAFELLDLKARGLLGPQINIPLIFAQEYAKRFFDRLLDSANVVTEGKLSLDGRVGDIVRALARQFRDEDNNPLGLVYSLYKGAECYVAWNAAQRHGETSAADVAAAPAD